MKKRFFFLISAAMILCAVFFWFSAGRTVFIESLPRMILFFIVVFPLSAFFIEQLLKKFTKAAGDIVTGDNRPPDYDDLLPLYNDFMKFKRENEQEIQSLKYRSDAAMTVINNMKEGLVLTDADGVILTANRSAAAVFGENEIAGRNILHICRDMELRQKMKECFTGRGSEAELNRSGKLYNVYLNPVVHDGELSGAAILFFDMTDSHKAERQRREFTANVSHELKTPLTTISALSEMIGNGMAKKEDVKTFAEKISQQAGRLIEIIDGIIKLSEFDENKTAKDFTDVELYSLAEYAANNLKEKADARRIVINVAGGQILIKANERMIDELLYNLIDNAIKYNRDGGEVKVELSVVNGCALISVADTGTGIPEADRGRIFERFYRVDGSRSKKTGGAGLGLSIVKHIVEFHRGRIELNSAVGTGTEIKCFIPVK